MVKKTYVIQIEYDEEKVRGKTATLEEALNVSTAHLDELIEQYDRDVERLREEGAEGISPAAEVIDHLDSGNLTGNDILFYIIAGYKSKHDCSVVSRKAAASGLLGLLGAMGAADETIDLRD